MQCLSNSAIISWGKNIRRSKSISEDLNIDDVHITPFKWMKKNHLCKAIGYLILFFKTLQVLFSNRYSSVIVVLPPVPPLYAVYIYSKFIKCDIILDCHNGILRNEWRSWPFLKRIVNSAKLVLVHNGIFKDSFVKEFSTDENKTIVLSDPLFKMNVEVSDVINHHVNSSSDSFNVFVPLSYAADEPVLEIINSASMVSNDIRFLLTGDFKSWHAKNSNISIPGNVIPLGYISDAEYFQHMTNSDLILCMTKGQDIQMCASIEAISLKKPMVCSKTDFYSSFVNNDLLLCENVAKDIAETLINCRFNLEYILDFMTTFHNEYNDQYSSRRITLLGALK